MTMVLLRRVAQGLDVDSRMGAAACGRTHSVATLPMQWLPVPGCVADASAAPAAAVRLRYVADGQPSARTFRLVRFSGDGAACRTPAAAHGWPTAHRRCCCSAPAASGFATRLVDRHPSWRSRVHAAGYLSTADLSAHIAACDLFVQPYPDGITSRRTSAMACLSRGQAGRDNHRPPD